MSVQRSIRRTSLTLGALLLAAVTSLPAQGRTLLEWSGRVDREVQISIRGRNSWTQGIERDDRGRASVTTALPRAEGRVTVRLLDGRGDVDVIQQPTRRNAYTAIIRVRDGRSGSDRYLLRTYWQPTNGRWDVNPYPRGDDGRYDDDRYDVPGRRNGRGRNDGIDTRPRDGDNDRSRGGNGAGNGYSLNTFRWTGRVDNEVEIRIQGQRVEYRVLSGSPLQFANYNVGQFVMPRRDAQISVTMRSGRGTVSVVQQPNARNSYTAVLRVKDSPGGYGYYDFDATWY
jgi:hypothetical protein